MVPFSILAGAAALNFCLSVCGAALPDGVDQPATAWEEPISKPVPHPAGPAIKKGHTVYGAEYGPEVGVWHDGPNFPLPKNFNDEDYMYIDDKTHRVLKSVTCTHMNPGNLLIGLQETYAKADGKDIVETSYHGWEPLLSFRERIHTYELAPNEVFTSVKVRWCGGKFTGIQFGTNRPGGGGVQCGNFEHVPGKDLPGCDGKLLLPGPSRKIIGLYGDANGVKKTNDQGIRGIGLITLPLGF